MRFEGAQPPQQQQQQRRPRDMITAVNNTDIIGRLFHTRCFAAAEVNTGIA